MGVSGTSCFVIVLLGMLVGVRNIYCSVAYYHYHVSVSNRTGLIFKDLFRRMAKVDLAKVGKNLLKSAEGGEVRRRSGSSETEGFLPF